VRLQFREQNQGEFARRKMLLVSAGSCFVPVLVWCMICLGSCNESPRQVQTTDNPGMMNDSLLKFNHGVVVAESQEIEDFITRYHWNMNKSQNRPALDDL